MKKLLILYILLFVSFNLNALAQGDNYQALSKISLTDSQKVKIEQIKNENQSQINSLQTQLKEKRNRLAALQKDDAASEAEINALETSIDATQASLSDLRVKSWLKIKAVLTPAQLDELRSLQFRH